MGRQRRRRRAPLRRQRRRISQRGSGLVSALAGPLLGLIAPILVKDPGNEIIP